MNTNKTQPDETPSIPNQKNFSHLTSVNLNKKAQCLKDELNQMNSKLQDFSQDLSDFYTNSSSKLKGDMELQWSAVDMTTKMYKKSDNPDALPDRIYTRRNSLLTELFQITHIRTIRNIFISIMIMFALQVMVNDVIQHGAIDLNYNLIRWAFGKFSLTVFSWLYMKFFTTCIVYLCFHYWSKSRIEYIKSIKTDDELKKTITGYDLTWLVFFICYLIGFIAIPAYVVITNNLPPASAMIVLMEQLRLLMKTYAFVRSNIPRALENGSYFAQNDDTLDTSLSSKPYNKQEGNTDSENDLSLDDNDGKILCPDFSKYLYFLFAPTLVYRDHYPRTSRINWNIVVSNFVQVIGSLFYVNYIFIRFCIPVFQNFNKDHVTLQLFLQSILNCHLSGTLLLLIGFFSFLHCWLNAFAEMLCFADRMFYKDWWNSTSFQSYYKTWNCVVHDFLYTYIYKDTHYLVGKKYRFVSQFAIFLISAIFHEYVLTLALGFFYPVLFIMFGALGFLLMFLRPKNNSNFWNFILWIFLQVGLGGLMCLYSIEWFARQNCDQVFESKVYDYLIPRSFTCGMNSNFDMKTTLSNMSQQNNHSKTEL